MFIEINTRFIVYVIISALLLVISYRGYTYYKKYKSPDTIEVNESSKSSNNMLFDELKLESNKSYEDYKC